MEKRRYVKDQAMNSWYMKIYRQTKKNAGQKSLAFSISESQLRYVINRSRGRCEVTGIEFSLSQEPGKRRRPYAPSLDRKDSAKGYLIGNIRLVCVAANYAMNEWGLHVLHHLALNTVKKLNETGADDIVDVEVSEFVGVSKKRAGIKKYEARIGVNGKKYALNRYKTPEEAQMVYLEAKRLVSEGKSIAHLITSKA